MTTPVTKPKSPTLRSDVMTVLSAVLAVVTVLHPGFKLPVSVETLVSSILAAGAVIFQIFGIHLRSKA
jgi:hypothetical protein